MEWHVLSSTEPSCSFSWLPPFPEGSAQLSWICSALSSTQCSPLHRKDQAGAWFWSEAALDGHGGVGVPRGASQGGRVRLWEPEAVCASGRTVGCVGFQAPGLGHWGVSRWKDEGKRRAKLLF